MSIWGLSTGKDILVRKDIIQTLQMNAPRYTNTAIVCKEQENVGA